MLAALFELTDTKRAFNLISSLGCRDKRYRFFIIDKKLAIPVKEDCINILEKFKTKIDLSTIEFDGMPKKRSRTRKIKQLEKDYKIPLPKSFNEVGDIILINEVPRNDDDYLRKMGSILRNEYGVRAVFIKRGEIKGHLRVAEWKRISGFGPPLTVHKENNLYYVVDFSKAFFNHRLGNERLRVYKKTSKGEKIVDLFTGVGSFAILLARKAEIVYGLDINCNAIELAKLNAKINGLSQKTIFICDDAKNALKYLDDLKVDRIIMNYPERSLEFLDIATSLSKRGTHIHLYLFIRSPEKNVEESATRAFLQSVREKKLFEIEKVVVVSEIAPRKYLVAIDVSVG